MEKDKKEFEELLRAYLSGTVGDKDVQKVDRWYDDLVNNELDLDESEKRVIRERILHNILDQKERKSLSLPAGRRGKAAGWYSVAAAIVLLLSSVLAVRFLRVSDPGEQTMADSQLETNTVVANDQDGTREVWLPDGTQVVLKGHSQLSYSAEFGQKKREVTLVGEAFFDVVRNTDRPFFVYTGNIVTRVLGTSFTMVAPPNASTIEVNVVSGRVSVYESTDEEEGEFEAGEQKKIKKGVILNRNQKVTYFVKENHLITSLVEQPRPIKTPTRENKLLIFEDQMLSEIATRLEENYSIEFVMENASIGNCTFTGDLSEMSLYDVLSIVCKSVGIEYEVMGTKILFNGEGCQKALAE